MAKKYDHISEDLVAFIQKQHLFFVGTAAETGTVNISPKGMDTFRIIDKNRVLWLNLTGSGNETAAHLLKNDRITIMFCAFEGKPLILRLYGQAKIYHDRDQEWSTYISQFPDHPGARQIVDIQVSLVQTSCGYGVPYMDYREDRAALTTWAKHKGAEEMKEYRKEKNTISLDGFPTGLGI